MRGYGYIQIGEAIGDTKLLKIDRFVEKPDAQKAEEYVATGCYLWNSGMFLLNAATYLQELATHAPKIMHDCRRSMSSAVIDLDFCRVDATAFEQCPSDSIDYAVMEKSESVAVLPFNSGWSDLGAWDAVLEQLPSDEDGNAVIGQGMVLDSRNTLISSERRVVAVIGVDDLLIVDTPDAVLVSHKYAAQEVKKVVDHLKTQSSAVASEHVIGYRPWGTYESIAKGEHFQVKKIIVKPGKLLSLQMHHHRAEHWIVVSGIAEVVNGEKTFTLKKESTFIPLGVKHRLANHGDVDLILIKVQSGSYLGEDDIVRFDDEVGRV